MSDLWVLAGQSNMEGVGDLIEVEPAHTKVRTFAHGDKWQTATEPLHWLLEANDTVHWCGHTEATIEKERAAARALRTKGAGCGLPFAKRIVEATGREVDLVPAAHGGTSMAQWSPDLKSDGGASLFGAMLRRVKLALGTQPGAELKGVLWYQGESDANPSDVAVYKDRMHRLIAAFREDLGAPKLPFYIVQLGPFAASDVDTDPNRLAWSQIRELQRLIPTEVPNTAVIPAIDLDLDDPIHIGTFGLKRLGQRLANVALGHVYGQQAPTPIALESVTRDGNKRDGNKVVVKFSGVNGGLRALDPSGRIPGFSADSAGRPDPALVFKAQLGGMDTVVLSLNDWAGLAPDTTLWYGYGYNPHCQLIDNADMAAPALLGQCRCNPAKINRLFRQCWIEVSAAGRRRQEPSELEATAIITLNIRSKDISASARLVFHMRHARGPLSSLVGRIMALLCTRYFAR